MSQSSAKAITVRYCFRLEKDQQEIFDLQLDAKTLEVVNRPQEDLPSWTKLDFHRCAHCPLDPSIHRDCLAASCLADVIKKFNRICSYDQLLLEVTINQRHISQSTTAQQGLRSLMGLLMATSGCPHTLFLKPMARFHLPLSNEEETFSRAIGMYLLSQYFQQQEGVQANLDLSGLQQLYRNLHTVNMAIAERLRPSVQADSSLNAVILLDLFTLAIPMVIEDKLDEIRHWFAPAPL